MDMVSGISTDFGNLLSSCVRNAHLLMQADIQSQVIAAESDLDVVTIVYRQMK